MKAVVDSNIPMYVAGQPHANQGPARRFLARVYSGEIEAITSTEVLQKILYRYSAIGRRELACSVHDLFAEICSSVLDITLADTDRARDLMAAEPSLSARDAIHAAVMLNHGISHIATFDRDFRRVPGLRIAPLP